MYHVLYSKEKNWYNKKTFLSRHHRNKEFQNVLKLPFRHNPEPQRFSCLVVYRRNDPVCGLRFSGNVSVLCQIHSSYNCAVAALFHGYSQRGENKNTGKSLPPAAEDGAYSSSQLLFPGGLYRRALQGFPWTSYVDFPVICNLWGSSWMLFFIDERLLLKRPLFYVSLLSAVAGVVLTISPGNSEGSSFSIIGVGLMLLSAFSWAILSALVKAWLPGYSPYFVNAAVFTFVIPLFLISHIATHGMQFHFEASPWLWFVLILSGLAGIGLGHSLFYRSIPHLGVSLANILQLTKPFFAALFSLFIFGERLSILQCIGGILLISGAYSAIKLKEKKTV